MNTAQLLDLVRERCQVSDYGLAQLLGVGQSTLSNYRNGRSHPDDRMALRLAQLAQLDAGQVIAWMQVERARTDETRAAWRAIADRLAQTAAVGLVALGISITPDAGASILSAGVSQTPADTPINRPSVYYVNLRRILRQVRSWCVHQVETLQRLTGPDLAPA